MTLLQLVNIVHRFHHVAEVTESHFDVGFDVLVNFEGLRVRVSTLAAFGLPTILTKYVETVGQVECFTAIVHKRQKTTLTMNPINF